MAQTSQTTSQKIIARLKISGVLFVITQLLSGVAFYYYYTTTPIIPLIVGLSGWLPAAIMLMSWHDLRLLKAEKTKQTHYPPQSSHKKEGEG